MEGAALPAKPSAHLQPTGNLLSVLPRGRRGMHKEAGPYLLRFSRLAFQPYFCTHGMNYPGTKESGEKS